MPILYSLQLTLSLFFTFTLQLSLTKTPLQCLGSRGFTTNKIQLPVSSQRWLHRVVRIFKFREKYRFAPCNSRHNKDIWDGDARLWVPNASRFLVLDFSGVQKSQYTWLCKENFLWDDSHFRLSMKNNVIRWLSNQRQWLSNDGAGNVGINRLSLAPYFLVNLRTEQKKLKTFRLPR